jgi:hypothetical protein
VSVGTALSAFNRFLEVLGLAKMVNHQFFLEGLVRGFGEHAFFFKNR